MNFSFLLRTQNTRGTAAACRETVYQFLPWVLFLSISTMSTFFLLLCLASYVSFFFFLLFSYFLIFSLHAGMFIFSVSLRLCSSHLLLSASTYFMVRILSACHLYPTPSRNCFVCLIVLLLVVAHEVYYFEVVPVYFFRGSYFLGGVFLLLCSRTRCASTWFAYLDFSAFGFSRSHCLWPQKL